MQFWERGQYVWVPITWYCLLFLLILALEARRQRDEQAVIAELKKAGALADLDRALKRAATQADLKKEPSSSMLQVRKGLKQGTPQHRHGRAALTAARLVAKLQAASRQGEQHAHSAGGIKAGLCPSPAAAASPSHTSVAAPGAPSSMPLSLLQALFEKVQDGTLSPAQAAERLKAMLHAWSSAADSLPKVATGPVSLTALHKEGKALPPGSPDRIPTAALLPSPSPGSEPGGLRVDTQLKRSPAPTRVLTDEGVPVITYEEFQEQVAVNDEKLTIIGGGVYDVAEFAQQHAGSAFVIIKSVGQDVTESFVGVDTLDPRIPSHKHSHRARAMLASMLVAVLDTSQTGMRALAAAEGESLAEAQHPEPLSTAHGESRRVADHQRACLWCCFSSRSGSVKPSHDSTTVSANPAEAETATPSPTPPTSHAGLRLGRASVVGTAGELEARKVHPWRVSRRYDISSRAGGFSSERPVVAFSLEQAESRQQVHVKPLLDWASFGLHLYVDLPASIDVDPSTGQLIPKVSDAASGDGMTHRRAFTQVRLPQVFTQSMQSCDAAALASWYSAIDEPSLDSLLHPSVQVWVRRFPAPRGVSSRFLHDMAGVTHSTLSIAGPTGAPLGLVAAVNGLETGVGPALAIAIAAGTGLAPFVDLAFALLAVPRLGGQHEPPFSTEVHLHLLVLASNPAEAVALPLLAFLAAASSRRDRGNRISVHVHFTRLSGDVSIDTLELPHVVHADVSQALTANSGVPWLCCSSGSLRDSSAASKTIARTLNHAMGALSSWAADSSGGFERLAACWICGPPGMADRMHSSFLSPTGGAAHKFMSSRGVNAADATAQLEALSHKTFKLES